MRRSVTSGDRGVELGGGDEAALRQLAIAAHEPLRIGQRRLRLGDSRPGGRGGRIRLLQGGLEQPRIEGRE